MEVLACATEKLSLDWPDEPRESQSSKLDERFLSGSGSHPTRRKLPFFPDLHHKFSRSWKQPFSSRLTNAAAADFTNLVGSVEQGYATASCAPLAEFRPFVEVPPPLLPSKSYMVAGQAGAALHTMAILQAYQAEVLKEMDEGDGVTPEAFKELRRATDLALRATKHTAQAVGRSIRKRRSSPNLLDRDGPRKRICPSLRYSPPPTAPSSRNVSRSAGHFPSSAVVEGKR